MIEEDGGAYYLEFFSRSIPLSLILSLFFAPVIPGWIAQYMLISVVVLALVFCLMFTWVRGVLLKLASRVEVNTSIQTLITNDAKVMFRVVGSTTLVLVLVIAWLGFAKLLWLFESFFVLFATAHIATALVYALLDLVAIREQINDDESSVYGAQSDLGSEETDASEDIQ